MASGTAKLLHAQITALRAQVAMLREPIRRLLRSFEIAAITVSIDYDPAGSSRTYEPSKRDLDAIQPLFNFPLTEDHLYFIVGTGGYSQTRYSLRGEVIDAALAATEADATAWLERQRKPHKETEASDGGK